jgi:hypothetical protein
MAQDTEEIYQEMLAEKQAKPELSGLDSPSGTAEWQIWLRLFAQLFHWLQEKWDAFKKELQAVVDANQFGTFEWWTTKVRSFQYGDMLLFINNKWQYPVIDPAKQIVKYVSVSDERGIVGVKAAKQEDNRPVPLSSQEAAALLSFIRDIRPPGTRLIVESLAADKLRSVITVYYNAQMGLNAISEAVESAYINYINSFNEVNNFDGVYYVNKMIDAIQAIPGVVEDQVVITEIAVKQGADPYTQIVSKYQAKSGYFEIDPDYPLSDTITYIGV